jgi:hypothetical protein
MICDSESLVRNRGPGFLQECEPAARSAAADRADPECPRIALDTNAKVKIGELSCGGSVRSAEPVNLLDRSCDSVRNAG